MSDKLARGLERELDGLLDGLTNLEKALVLAAAFREAYGDEWAIDAKADGGFSITRVLPKAQKPL